MCAGSLAERCLRRNGTKWIRPPPCSCDFIFDLAYAEREGRNKSVLFENCVVGLISACAYNENAAIEIKFSQRRIWLGVRSAMVRPT